MNEFVSPLTADDLQRMQEIAQRCEQRSPVIEALDSLGIDVKGLDEQNRAQQAFCTGCARARSEGKL